MLTNLILTAVVGNGLVGGPAYRQQAPSRPDSSINAEARRRFIHADSLSMGEGPERRLAASEFRRAGELFLQARDSLNGTNAIIRAGQVFYAVSQIDSALSCFRAAVPLLRAAGSKVGEARMLSNIGTLYNITGKPDSALIYLRQAAPMFSEQGDQKGAAAILMNLGNLFTQTDQTDSALAYYRKAVPALYAAGDRENAAGTLGNMGIVFRDIGRRDSAMAAYRKALPIQREIGDHEGESATLGNIGTLLHDFGQLDSALTYHRQALQIARQFGNRVGELSDLMNIGSVFNALGQGDSALSYYHDALPIQRAVGDRKHEGATLNNIGATFRLIRQLDSALTYYYQAARIQIEVDDKSGLAGTLENLGNVFLAYGHPDSALAYYHQALPIQRAVGYRADEAETLDHLGEIFSDLKQPDSALAYFHQALSIRHDVGVLRGEAETLANLGDLYRRNSRPDSAVRYFDRATALIGAVSSHAGSDFNRLSFNETTTYWYGAWTLAWLALDQSYGALAASERGRAQALLELMRDTTQSSRPGGDLPAEGKRLADVVRGTTTGGLIYFFAGDTLVTWVIQPTGPVRAVERAIKRDSLSLLVQAFRSQLGVGGASRLGLRGTALELTSESAGSETSSGDRERELSAILLPPEVLKGLAGFKEIVIVPQGALALLPFAALSLPGSDEQLGDRIAIRYAPSLGTLGQAEARQSPGARIESLRQAVIVGNPLMPKVTIPGKGSERLIPLPGAETEAGTIAKELGSTALSGAKATESEVVRRLSGAPLVHLATHGFAYSGEAKARSSFVALAPDSTDDGLLTVGEILDNPKLRLTADLVVLSACQTGLGNLKESEGTVGLQRAFLAKGARSVLVSLWNVSDDATSALMSAFYRHWLRDGDRPSKAEALRRSQEEIRHRPGWEHPRFWAAFQLVGAR